MTVLGWALFGFVAGLIARAITPGRDPLGIVGAVMLGIAGALVAGWTGQAIGIYRADEQAGFVSATLGAAAVLAFYTYSLRQARANRIRELRETAAEWEVQTPSAPDSAPADIEKPSRAA